MIRLVIADDQAVVRAGLSVILGAEEDIEVWVRRLTVPRR